MNKEQWQPDPELIAFLEKAVNEARDPNKPIMGTGKRSWSTTDLLNEVRSGTEFGRKYQTSWKRLRDEGEDRD